MAVSVIATVLFMCIRENVGKIGTGKKSGEEKKLLDSDDSSEEGASDDGL